ncbi:MAG: winged helix-turn-helix domain-containing protein [Oligoflexia bacterium]|nr:winged helix-turn-helix domain-containing protein [Oligoflexia bacterium]
MILTERDNRIINVLQQQDFCFYKDIANKFFSSETSASLRLKKLKEKGFIRIESIYSPSFNKIMDTASMPFIGGNKKVIRLNNKYKLIKRKPSYWKIKHQLLLFSLKERLEKLLGHSAVFENDIRNLRDTLYNGKWEPLPDFYIKGEDYKLAVELELHIKSKGRYWRKTSDYRNSRFTHVLYVVTNVKKVNSLIRSFKHYKYIGIAHYSREDELTNFWYGKLSLLEWLKKRTK